MASLPSGCTAKLTFASSEICTLSLVGLLNRDEDCRKRWGVAAKARTALAHSRRACRRIILLTSKYFKIYQWQTTMFRSEADDSYIYLYLEDKGPCIIIDL